MTSRIFSFLLAMCLAVAAQADHAGFTSTSSNGSDNQNVTVYNNTGGSMDEVTFDLSGLLEGTYSMMFQGGAWSEVGDLTDQTHKFRANSSFLNMHNGQNRALNINFDMAMLADDYGITDLSTLGIKTYPHAAMGQTTAGTQHLADLDLYDFSSASAVPLPAGLWLFASALIGLGAIKQRK